MDKERSTLIDQYDHSDCDEINFKLQIIAENHLKSLEASKAAEAPRELPAEPIKPPEVAAIQAPTPKKAVVPQKKTPARDGR